MKVIPCGVALILLAAITISCHSDDNKAPAGVVGQAVIVQGFNRHYFVWAPSADKPIHGVVMLFHGHGGSAEHLLGMKRMGSPYVRWLQIAQQENLILLIPKGEIGSDGKSGWADCRLAASQPPTDDLAFVDAMLLAVQKQRPFNPRRVFAIGTSNGGHFVLRLAHERPGLLAGAAILVASEAAESRCSAAKQGLPILFINGTDDPFSKWQGGQVGKVKHLRGTTLSVMGTVNYWVHINHAQAKAKINTLPDINTNDRSRVVLHRYAALPNGKPVLLYEVQGGGHTEPSIHIGYPKIFTAVLGTQNRDIEMADVVWRFFSGSIRNSALLYYPLDKR